MGRVHAKGHSKESLQSPRAGRDARATPPSAASGRKVQRQDVHNRTAEAADGESAILRLHAIGCGASTGYDLKGLEGSFLPSVP